MEAPSGDGVDPRDWIGRTEARDDLVTAVPVAALAATLDRSDPFPVDGEALRPLRHWLFTLQLAARRELGPDGHAQRGAFLPPIALPRRMWAGSRLRFAAPLRVGARIRRVSTIADVVEKTGRAGRLAFVVVRHTVHERDALLVSEEHDIVYREPASAASEPGRPSSAPRVADVSREVCADEVLLFRYSALTFNGHRIHYDRRYASEEGYPALVVHGPLLATLLADLAVDINPGRVLTTYSFRALAPVFDGTPFRLNAKAQADGSTVLWIETTPEALAMEALATFV